MKMKRVYLLFQNIVGAECIVCIHWLNIVGAAAPTAPMVPTPMSHRHGRRKRGGGGQGDASPAVEKSAGDVPPEISTYLPIFQYFFLTRLNI